MIRRASLFRKPRRRRRPEISLRERVALAMPRRWRVRPSSGIRVIAFASPERWPSGRRRWTGIPVTSSRVFVGSNPTLSATKKFLARLTGFEPTNDQTIWVEEPPAAASATDVPSAWAEFRKTPALHAKRWPQLRERVTEQREKLRRLFARNGSRAPAAKRRSRTK